MNQRLILSGIALLILVLLLAGPALAATMTCPSSCSCLLPAEAAKINTPGLCGGKQTVCGSDGKTNKYCYLKPVTTTTVVPQIIVTGFQVFTPTTTVPAFVKCGPGCDCEYEPWGEKYNLTLCNGRQSLCGMDPHGVRMYCYVQPPPPPPNIVPPVTLVTMTIHPVVTTVPLVKLSSAVSPSGSPAGIKSVQSDPGQNILSCSAGCSCLPSDEASAAGFRRCSDSQKTCGFDSRNNAKYCYIVDPGSPADGALDRMPVNPQLPAEPSEPDKAEPQPIAQIGIIDSLIGMFSGFFGKPDAGSPGLGKPTGTVFDPELIHPVNSYRVATTIEKGATVYIGEEYLNVTHALNGARLLEIYHVGALDETPTLTRIGFFTADPFTTAPTRTLDLGASGRYRSMLVSPADFVGYTGTWYLLNSEGTSPYSHSAVVFTVRDPQLALDVTNAKTRTSVSGATVSAGDQLRFSITKNIGVAGPTGDLRGPITDSVSDGFMDIVVTAPGGVKLTQLDVMDGGSPKVTSLSRPCWDLPADSACNPSWTWNTGATYGNGTARYPPGTYTVQVISKLNGMHNNYRQAGALYEGKTASHTITFKLK